MAIFVDVTHILGWQKSLTGIERVEYHIIRHYIENTDCQFVVWNMSLGKWLGVKNSTVRRLLEGHKTNDSSVQQEGEGRLFKLSQRVFGKLKRIGDYQKTKLLAGDRLIILAGLWDNSGYIEGLKDLAYVKKVDLVHIVYDMIPAVQPGLVLDFMPKMFRNYMMNILPLCKKILAISKASAVDTRVFLEAHKKQTPSIEIFRLGDDMLVTAENKKLTYENEPFCLMVGTIEIRKNHMLLYYVYRMAAEKNIKLPRLVVAGKNGWMTESIRYLFKNDPILKEKVVLTGSISDSKLARLYEKALYTIVPSLYEGWGLQVSESLARGTIVLASNTSSVPEVGGSCCEYFSPFSPDELLKLMEEYSKPSPRKKKEKYIAANYKRLEWADAAAEFAKLAAKD